MTKMAMRRSLPLLLMALPLLALFFVFNYIPMAGVLIAFKKFQISKGFLGSPWVGFENFKFFFQSQDAWRVTRNTIGYNGTFIVINMCIAVAFAIFLNEIQRRGIVKMFQTVFFFPYFISWVVAGYMFYAFLNTRFGILNNWLEAFGIGPVSWYAEKPAWPFILLVAYVWKHLGYHCILYYAALMGISPELYESAAIDGASKIDMIFRITLPLLRPVITVVFLLQIGKIFFADFGMFYYIPWNTGILYPVTDVIDTYVFRSLRVVGNIGMSAAAGFYQSVMGLITVLTANWLVRRFDSDNAMF